ncbi:MAG: hypothetical protein HYU66_27795 [Armatimonadetes bacterium]|nr:hypothetical protein [Armatimonadota bacterium]
MDDVVAAVADQAAQSSVRPPVGQDGDLAAHLDQVDTHATSREAFQVQVEVRIAMLADGDVHGEAVGIEPKHEVAEVRARAALGGLQDLEHPEGGHLRPHARSGGPRWP